MGGTYGEGYLGEMVSHSQVRLAGGNAGINAGASLTRKSYTYLMKRHSQTSVAVGKSPCTAL